MLARPDSAIERRGVGDIMPFLPAMRPRRYGAFSAAGGNEVMVLAWGTESQCYWGYVTIERQTGQTR